MHNGPSQGKVFSARFDRAANRIAGRRICHEIACWQTVPISSIFDRIGIKCILSNLDLYRFSFGDKNQST
jgi:hypothetical protein